MALLPREPLLDQTHQAHLRWREINPFQQLFLGLALLLISQMAGFLPHEFSIHAGWSLQLGAFTLLVGQTLGAALSVIGFAGIIRWRAKRPAWEFSTRGAGKELGAGLLVGAVAVSLPILVLWALGMYRVSGVRVSADILASLGMGIGAGFIEEIFIRGFVLRLSERAMGTWAALIFSSLLFGLGHLGNRDAGVLGAIAIGVEAGILLGAAYLVTRRLWLAVGIHIAWNAVQGGLWSSAISGTGERRGLLVAQFDGPAWLTGGSMGIEGSVLAIASCLIFAAWMLVEAHRRGLFAGPSNWPWRWRQARPFHPEISAENPAALPSEPFFPEDGDRPRE